jgi:hypothetical protein
MAFQLTADFRRDACPMIRLGVAIAACGSYAQFKQEFELSDDDAKELVARGVGMGSGVMKRAHHLTRTDYNYNNEDDSIAGRLDEAEAVAELAEPLQHREVNPSVECMKTGLLPPEARRREASPIQRSEVDRERNPSGKTLEVMTAVVMKIFKKENFYFGFGQHNYPNGEKENIFLCAACFKGRQVSVDDVMEGVVDFRVDPGNAPQMFELRKHTPRS